MQLLILMLRALALGVSFAGLSMCARTLLKLDRFVAPFFTGCAVIVVLMLTGMANALQAGFLALYAGGFAGFILCLIRREKPDLPVAALLAVFCAYLAWRFFSCHLHHCDDVSHWGLVARSILNRDAFPDASVTTVKFQSYPVGSAAFIYYICRTLGNSEGLYVAAQSLLMGLGFLPMLAHIRASRRYLYPVAAVGFLFLFQRNQYAVNLQVDWLLPFLGLGAVASVLRHGSETKKAALVAAVSSCAIVCIKNSGMFFAAAATVVLVWAARKNGLRGRRLFALAASSAAVFIGMYLLWTLRVKLAYPAGFDTKHAVSAGAYAAELASKGVDTALAIGSAMLRFLLIPNLHQLSAYAVLFACAAAVIAGCLMTGGQRAALRGCVRGLALAAGAYLLWYLMLFFMYLFSMPASEAVALASINRYVSTGLLFMMGLALLVLFRFYGREGLTLSRSLRRLWLAAGAVCAAALIALFPLSSAKEKLLHRETAPIDVRSRLIAAKEQLDLPPDSRIMVYFVNEAEGRAYYHSYYYLKYEFDTADAVTIVSGTAPGQPGTVYARYTHGQPLEWLDDPLACVADNIDQCDAFILADSDPGFEAQVRAFLQTYEGDTPVVFACS